MKLPKIAITGSNLINVVGAVIIVYLLVTLTETVKHNYDLNRQVDALNSQITLLQAQKAQQAYNLQYYGTDSFRDRQARTQLGLQLPGENVIIIPSTSPTPAPEAAAPAKTSGSRSNLQQWFSFLGGQS